MLNEKPSLPPETIWTYGYEIVPPQSEERLRTIKALIDIEHADAMYRARTWRANIVLEKQVTHILVMSDSADQDRAINRRLEAALKHLNAGFSITAPMAVTVDVAPWRAAEALTHLSLK